LLALLNSSFMQQTEHWDTCRSTVTTFVATVDVLHCRHKMLPPGHDPDRIFGIFPEKKFQPTHTHTHSVVIRMTEPVVLVLTAMKRSILSSIPQDTLQPRWVCLLGHSWDALVIPCMWLWWNLYVGPPYKFEYFFVSLETVPLFFFQLNIALVSAVSTRFKKYNKDRQIIGVLLGVAKPFTCIKCLSQQQAQVMTVFKKKSPQKWIRVL